MSELSLRNLCRLCLQESFLHANVFVDRVPYSSLIYEVLNFVYDLEISIDDGLSANICRPCYWKLREFEIYKINVHQAKSELLKDRVNSVKEEAAELVVSDEENESNKEIEGERSSQDVSEEGTMTASTPENSIKEEVAELVVSDEKSASNNEIEESHSACTALAVNTGITMECLEHVIKKDPLPQLNKETNTQIMPKRKSNHFVDKCFPQTSKRMRYMDCARLEVEENLDNSQCVANYGAQEKGKPAIKSRSEKRGSECENIDIMASKEAENGLCNIRENEEKKMSSKEIEKENEERMNRLKNVRVVKRITENRCLISEGEDGIKYYNCGNQRNTKEEIATHIQVVHGFSCREKKGDQKNELANNGCREKMSKEDIGKHSRERKRYICNACDKTFISNRDLKRHIRIHTKEKPYKCSICKLRFTQPGNLKRHIQTHSGEKPFKCSICDRNFSQKGHLLLHIAAHKGEKSYKCTTCDYKCIRNERLKSHMRVHSGEKPYKCPICNTRFAQNEYLKVHIRIHTKEKPHHCSICDYKCTQRGSLKKHMNIHNR